MVREQEKREKERQIFGAMERRMKGKAKGVEKRRDEEKRIERLKGKRESDK